MLRELPPHIILYKIKRETTIKIILIHSDMSNSFDIVKQALFQLNQSISQHFERIHEAIQIIIPSSTEVVPTEEYAASIRVAMESLRTVKNNQAAMEQLLQEVVNQDNSELTLDQVAQVGRLQFTTILNIQVNIKQKEPNELNE